MSRHTYKFSVCKHCGEPVHQRTVWWDKEWAHKGGRTWCIRDGRMGDFLGTKAEPKSE